MDEWVKSAANEELFYQWLVEYEYQQPQYLADGQKAIEQFGAYADRTEENAIPDADAEGFAPSRLRIRNWLVAASVTIVLIGSSF